jgi:hypothetical protein
MGRLLLTHGLPNDVTRLYWRSSIGLPMQQLKPGGGGGGWICHSQIIDVWSSHEAFEEHLAQPHSVDFRFAVRRCE